MNLDAIFQSFKEREIITKRTRQEALAAKVLKCPKCRCDDIIVHETIEAISEHRVINGIWVHKHDNNEFGNSIRTECTCTQCEHQWTSKRGINFDNYYISEE